MAPRPDEQADELTALAEDLLTQASALRRQWELLGEALAGAEATEPDSGNAADAAPEEEADPRLLVALDMALSGRSREEVGDYLRTTFGEDGTDAILAEVFERA